MKYYLIILLFFISFLTFSNYIYDPYNFTRTISEPVQWSPEEGVYSNTIYLNITSQYGKIFYIVNGTLGEKEPTEFTKEIVLQGKAGGITDYNILIILEKSNGNIELYSRTYRIDKTKSYNINYSENKNYLKEEVNYEKNKFRIKYDFNSTKYNVAFADREFVFPQKIIDNESASYNLELSGEKSKKSLFLVSCNYNKEDKIFSEVKAYQLNLTKPKAPSFGSLYWARHTDRAIKLRLNLILLMIKFITGSGNGKVRI